MESEYSMHDFSNSIYFLSGITYLKINTTYAMIVYLQSWQLNILWTSQWNIAWLQVKFPTWTAVPVIIVIN